MSATDTPGQIMWHDLTVDDAEQVKDFYAAVVGWTTSEVPMPGYVDYGMHEAGKNDMVAGVCHARGSNANIPPQWLMYVRVANLEHSAEQAVRLGGEVIDGPRNVGAGRFMIVRDPAGAIIGLYHE